MVQALEWLIVLAWPWRVLVWRSKDSTAGPPKLMKTVEGDGF
jgi:hypothetical protein